ncbi:hypothetical protein [Lactiplantibacillus plantarum]|nr:hypothetical protein [Lactiplantibacillus plantarum]KZD99602.1 hypothetical protein FBR6_1669 [Lactiplantibacillus plantarum]
MSFFNDFHSFLNDTSSVSNDIFGGFHSFILNLIPAIKSLFSK